MNALEEVLGQINEDTFLGEFSFSKNQFSPMPGSEREFADSVVWLKGLLLLIQAKERVGSGDHDRWFKRKVLGHGTKQIRDTLSFLESHAEIQLTNRRGHAFSLSSRDIQHVVKLVVYRTDRPTPLMLSTRHHESRTAGVIHVLSVHDYLNLARTLATPVELLEYYDFREQLLARSRGKEALPSEKALAGQFLSGHLNADPRPAFEEMVDRFLARRESWDVSRITQRFSEKITFQATGTGMEPGGPTQYYSVLAELAFLSRTELASFRERFDRIVEAAKEGRFHVPLRMIAERGCGFLFLALPADKAGERLRGLQNLTFGSKYEQRLQRHVGVIVTPEDGDLLIDWIFMDFEWRHEPALEEMLETNNPFLPLKYELIPRYRFVGEKD